MVGERLLDVLNLVAGDFEIQTDVFPSYVQIPDEIALLYDDEFCQLQATQADLTDLQFAKLSEIDAIFESMSGKPVYWSLEAMRTNPRWIRVREVAKEALLALGEVPRRPRMNWFGYEQGGN